MADIRAGIYTVKDRWQVLSGRDAFVHAEKYLQPLYGGIPAGKNLWIDASMLADRSLANAILSLDESTALADETGFIAGILDIGDAEFDAATAPAHFKTIQQVQNVRRLQHPWQIFQWNEELLKEDFKIITSGRTSHPIPSSNQCINQKDIFIEEGAEVNFSILNASTGPIYIGKNAVIMEGSLIRGPFALCEGAVVKMGAKIYGATTLGPYCTAGGEIKNSIMQAYSNKGHDGYLGDAVIGRWCNLGAGTSNSNVKNTGAVVKMWAGAAGEYLPVGVKGGVIMGDYSRTAINSAINTGTVIGICCNIFDGGLLPKHIPSFSWGGKTNSSYIFEKALDDIGNWKKMKQQTLNDAEKGVLKHIFDRI